MRKNSWILVVVAALLLTQFCFETVSAAKPVVVGLAWNRKDQSLVIAWEDYMKAYSKEYGKKIGRDFRWIVNVADGDPARQDANIRDLISMRVDVIITRPEDSAAIGAAIRAANRAGIPIITFDRESSGATPTAHVGADAYKQALSTAEEFAKILEANGLAGKVKAIELLGDLRDENAVKRSKGWHDVEDRLGAWETVVQVPTEWDAEKFYSGTVAALSAYPEANAMFVASDFCFSAVQQALQKSKRWAPQGKAGHMWIAGQDLNPQGLDATLGGYMDVATTYDAWYHSVTAVEVIGKILAGEELNGQKFLVAGRVATPQNIRTLDHIWALDYQD